MEVMSSLTDGTLWQAKPNLEDPSAQLMEGGMSEHHNTEREEQNILQSFPWEGLLKARWGQDLKFIQNLCVSGLNIHFSINIEFSFVLNLSFYVFKLI